MAVGRDGAEGAAIAGGGAQTRAGDSGDGRGGVAAPAPLVTATVGCTGIPTTTHFGASGGGARPSTRGVGADMEGSGRQLTRGGAEGGPGAPQTLASAVEGKRPLEGPAAAAAAAR